MEDDMPWLPHKQSAYFERKRKDLIRRMGGQCVKCGERKYDLLEIDHTNGRDWEPKKTSRSKRYRFYEKEWIEGKIRILCRKCNAKYQPHRKEEPF
jgi:5-methylcytosine-specific restriction endonuclease McrA